MKHAISKFISKQMSLKLILLKVILWSCIALSAQDTTVSHLRLSLTLLDAPQNFENHRNIPSMVQSSELASNLFDLSFWGIDALENTITKPHKHKLGGRIANSGLKYHFGLAFSYYGSELPIPLGVYNHEEFHRSVLGVNSYKALNGNWIFNLWDGTVYGLTDSDLMDIKQNNLNGLLHSFVAGVQSEAYLTQVNVNQDFYHKRSFYKNPLYLHNAWYVWNYFRFTASSVSDSVKVLTPPHEDSNPYYRDYAGADLTAWVYDIYTPEMPFTDRDPFPNGEGVNRRVGFGDLSQEGQNFLKKQKTLTLLNFVNPAIFMINRIKVTPDFSFQLFRQYNPTHFGNDISLYMPFQMRLVNQLLVLHNYHNNTKGYLGFQYGIYELHPFNNKHINLGGTVSFWTQPENQGFFDISGKPGCGLDVQTDFKLGKQLSAHALTSFKTRGWLSGYSYLKQKGLDRIGLANNLTL